MVEKILLYFRTIKDLKLIQILFRAKNSINLTRLKNYRSKNYQTNSFPDIRDIKNIFFEKRRSIISEDTLSFLNRTRRLHFPNDWNNKEFDILWNYNLHYFDGLNNYETSFEEKTSLIYKWIKDNEIGYGVGWDPYPTSLRTVNWIKFCWISSYQSDEINDSLFEQGNYLYDNLEYHLLGNHLLENAKALIFLGVYFSGAQAKKWLNKGVEIIVQQSKEQILNDGGHFELSPMYHSIMLELYIDLFSISKLSIAPTILQKTQKFLKKIICNMSEWLDVMHHPDNRLPHFNDSAHGIAPEVKNLLGSARSITKHDLTCNPRSFLESSGFYKITKDDYELFFDVGDIGPSFLPGHGHADSLSIEMSLFKQRCFVNLGTSIYQDTERRKFERSTAAHNTIEIDHTNSSEVWSSFRVGRKAKIIDIQKGSNSVSATHDGYRFLKGAPLHTRKIVSNSKNILVEDRIKSSSSHTIIARYHLHPCIRVSLTDNKDILKIILKNGKEVYFKALQGSINLIDNYYAEGFGSLSSCKTIEIISNDHENICVEVNWK